MGEFVRMRRLKQVMATKWGQIYCKVGLADCGNGKILSVKEAWRMRKRKLMTVMLAAVLALSLAACGGEKKPVD